LFERLVELHTIKGNTHLTLVGHHPVCISEGLDAQFLEVHLQTLLILISILILLWLRGINPDPTFLSFIPVLFKNPRDLPQRPFLLTFDRIDPQRRCRFPCHGLASSDDPWPPGCDGFLCLVGFITSAVRRGRISFGERGHTVEDLALHFYGGGVSRDWQERPIGLVGRNQSMRS